jgi:hypothetical protein
VAGGHPAPHPVGRAGGLRASLPWSRFDPRLLLSRFWGPKLRLAQPNVPNFGHLEPTKAPCAVPASVSGMECNATSHFTQHTEERKCLPRLSRGRHNPARPAERLRKQSTTMVMTSLGSRCSGGRIAGLAPPADAMVAAERSASDAQLPNPGRE